MALADASARFYTWHVAANRDWFCKAIMSDTSADVESFPRDDVAPKAPLEQSKTSNSYVSRCYTAKYVFPSASRDDPGEMTGHEQLDRPKNIDTTGKFRPNLSGTKRYTLAV